MADVSYLTIDHAPNKTTYVAGDKFERYGMVVTAHYTDGTTSNVDIYAYSPIGLLTTSNTQITITAFEKTVTQAITVINPPSTGYFVDKCLGDANYGNNPYINTIDGSITFYNNPITVERDSYAINLVLSYHSRMTDKESDLISGFFKGFRTNYHQFLKKDGKDSDNIDTYKYIDGSGYFHTFVYNSSLNKYYDKDGYGMFLDVDSKTITDQKGNILTFDANWRLVSIQSGLNPAEIKRITYTSDGIKKIYDDRNPNTYIEFTYNYSFLQYIKAYYNSSLLKTYTFYGFFGQITSIDETVGNNTRTLYQYSVNDRDRINRIIDCLTKEAYRITYTFDSNLRDYRFDSLRNGYINGSNTFVQQKGLYFVDYKYDANANYKLAYEFVIRNDNNIDLSFMSDSNGRMVSTFERGYNDEHNYYSLIRDAGNWIPHQGSCDDSISDSRAADFSNTLTISYGLSSTDLDKSQSFKLVGYIKIKERPLRAKLSMSAQHTTSHQIDVNYAAYNVWQYFEILIDRDMNGSSPYAFSSFTLSLLDENNYDINAEVANLQFVKCDSRQKLYFLLGNNSQPICFDSIKALRIYTSNYDYYTIEDNYSSFYMNQNDLLKTMKEYYTTSFNNRIAYFGNDRIVRKFYPVIVGETQNDIVPFFNPTYVNNDEIGANNNWFFASSPNALVKTYYRFKEDYYEVIVRTQTGANAFEETLKRYNYKDQVILEINKFGSQTQYEYFADGNLKKKTVIFVENGITKTVVLFEATLDIDNKYVMRVRQEDKGFDYQYNNGLLIKRIINDLYQEQPTNQYFSIEQTYDGFLSDLSNVKFKNIDSIEEEHNYSRPSTSYKTNYINDTVSKYRITKTISSRTTKIGIHDGNNYVDILTIKQTPSSTKKTYNNSYSYGGGEQIVEEILDEYNRPYQIIADGTTMVTYQYAVNHASQYCSSVGTITDNFSGKNVSYTYDSNNEISSIEIGTFVITYSKVDDYSCTELAFDNNEKYTLKVNDKEVICKKGNNNINSAYWKYDYDSLLRLSAKSNNKFSHNIFQEYSYSSNYPSRITQYNYDGNVYNEIYSYSQFYGHLTGASISSTNLTSTITYQYDGFGRLIGETNSKLGINRTYLYKPNSNIPGPVGRMTKFGNEELIYDDRGRLIEFGDNIYGYDEYGNRISKNAESYQWTRGRLLSCLGFARYYYDYRGIRTSKLDNDGLTHNYYYNGNNLVGEDILNGTSIIRKLRFFYDKDGLCAFRTIIGSTTKDYVYIRNPLNNIVGICEGVTLKALYVYDAWGNHKVYNPNGTENTDSSFIGNINPFRYRSYYYDSESNLYYLKSRYYDSEIGQFISPDDVKYLSFNDITGVNLYAYCRYNPVTNYDPNGHFILSTFFFSVVAIRLIGKSAEQGSGLIGSIWRQFETNGLAFDKWNWKELGGIVSDIFFDALAFSIGYSFGNMNPLLGALSYFGINQLINTIYYNFISNPDYSIKDDSYNGGNYLTRWQRLDYTKTKKNVDQNNFGIWEMHIFGEYTLHMAGFFAFPFWDSLWSADVEAGPDNHVQPLGYFIDILSFLLCLTN